jgi:hypothetical protein
MRQSYFFTVLVLSLSLFSFGQEENNFERSFEPIRAELNSWDAVRGEWLANSIVAMSNQQPIPDRTFPESITPAQMYDLVPPSTRDQVASIAASTQANDPNWNTVRDFTSRPNCRPTGGRSYGDPHLQSFDGARYSFQTVGEFVLAKSNNGAVEVQTRQKAQRSDFSLNTAVAMNVNGDRVCIYAEDVPDFDRSTPLRINGQAITVTDNTYFLSNGGTVRKSRGKYIVDWPTGESVTAQIRNSGGMSFLNISTSVYPCINGGYNGLLGNANGRANDDFNTTRGVSPIRFAGNGGAGSYVEKQHLAFLAREFAEEHRITMATSLFDYPGGTSTLTFTDRSFPRVHHSIDDLDMDRRNRARRHCESNGIAAADMEGCIYDNAFLGLPPSPRQPLVNPTEGMELKPVKEGILNTNENPISAEQPRGIRGTTIYDLDEDEPTFEGNSDRFEKMTEEGEAAPRMGETESVRDNDVRGTTFEPTPPPAPKPRPVIKAPTPKPKPRPVPKPKPKVNNGVGRIGGR